MKIILICHKGSLLSYEALPYWIGSFAQLAGMVVIDEKQNKKWERIKKEKKRSGFWGLIDVFLFRFFYKLAWQTKDNQIEKNILENVKNKYGPFDLNSIDKITVTTPNSPETQAFISSKSPDFVIARCKFLLKERIFDIASYGTFVFHPGICPEYRNAHGCFWAILNRDYERVGMTMLRIDKGVDTGPIYGYFSYDYNPVKESHVTIQSRVVFENLDAITEKIKEIFQKTATPLTIDKDRKSRVWGQPRLTKWIKWNMNKRLN